MFGRPEQRGRRKLLEKVQAMGLDPRVVAAFTQLDRAEFVPEGADAYSDSPVGIPAAQTTSQPSLIALMVDALRPRVDHVVLEVGTGFGFQTALLARLVGRVVSIERHAELAEAARENIARNGLSNVRVLVGDGTQGFPDAAPFDGIIVSAAAAEVPQALCEQLAEGGRLVIPVKRGPSDDVLIYEKRGGRVREVDLLTPARFVPLVPDA